MLTRKRPMVENKTCLSNQYFLRSFVVEFLKMRGSLLYVQEELNFADLYFIV
jgi:hypothetical protein